MVHPVGPSPSCRHDYFLRLVFELLKRSKTRQFVPTSLQLSVFTPYDMAVPKLVNISLCSIKAKNE
jgi:hypothetical protein